MLTVFLAAMDQTIVRWVHVFFTESVKLLIFADSTALPAMIADLGGSSGYSWASSYNSLVCIHFIDFLFNRLEQPIF